MAIKHALTSGKSDSADPTEVQPGDWNDDHVGMLLARKTADKVLTSSSFVNDDHLFFAIVANEVWVAEFFLIFQSPQAADIQFAITAPAGATIAVALSRQGGGTTEFPVYAVTTTAGGGIVIQVDAEALRGAHLFVSVDNGGTSGNVQLQAAQGTTDAGTTTLFTGSWLRAYRID